jgi:hypothetical protein
MHAALSRAALKAALRSEMAVRVAATGEPDGLNGRR